jgi:hypothetical protein
MMSQIEELKGMLHRYEQNLQSMRDQILDYGVAFDRMDNAIRDLELKNETLQGRIDKALGMYCDLNMFGCKARREAGILGGK